MIGYAPQPIMIDLDDRFPDRVVIKAGDMDTYLVQQLPGQLFRDNEFTAPLSWATWMACQGVFSDRLWVGERFSQWTRQEYAQRVQPCMAIRQAVDVLGDFDERLYPFQRAGVSFMATAERAVLADEVGSGKTVQTIMALHRLADFGHVVTPALCIVPNSTKAPWRDHWADWWPELKVIMVDGSATTRRKQLEEPADVYVINWEAVELHSRLAGYGAVRLERCMECGGDDPRRTAQRCHVHPKELNRIKFRTVVVDEAHRMKNPLANRTRAVWSVQHGSDSRYRFALTGTPIAAHPGDLYGVMHGIAPDEYPTKGDYVDRYCYQAWNYGGTLEIIGINPDTRHEFFGFFDPRFRRMPKELVLPFLPPIVHERRDAPMSAKQAKSYRELKKTMMTTTQDGDLIITKNALDRNTRLSQFASALCVVDENDDVQMTIPSPKIDILEELLEDAAKPVAVCAESRKLIELASERLEKHKIPHHVMVGGSTADVRNAMLRDLNNGTVRALLFTIKAGGEGVNMTGADTLIRLQRGWSMIEHLQTIGRVHRIGSEQHESVTVIDIVAPGTIEEDQFTAILQKQARLDEITRDKDTLRTQGRIAELQQLEQEETTIMTGSLL